MRSSWAWGRYGSFARVCGESRQRPGSRGQQLRDREQVRGGGGAVRRLTSTTAAGGSLCRTRAAAPGGIRSRMSGRRACRSCSSSLAAGSVGRAARTAAGFAIQQTIWQTSSCGTAVMMAQAAGTAWRGVSSAAEGPGPASTHHGVEGDGRNERGQRGSEGLGGGPGGQRGEQRVGGGGGGVGVLRPQLPQLPQQLGDRLRLHGVEQRGDPLPRQPHEGAGGAVGRELGQPGGRAPHVHCLPEVPRLVLERAAVG